mgnify:CR=1 FL=1
MMRVFGFCILFILIITNISCNRDVNNISPNGPDYGYMSASINGNYWSATTGYAQSPSAFTLSLYGTYNQASYITINISNYNGPGAYTLGGFNTAIFYDGYGNEYDATSGTVSVTYDVNNQVKGYFSFSGIATYGGSVINVSGGQFNLSR